MLNGGNTEKGSKREKSIFSGTLKAAMGNSLTPHRLKWNVMLWCALKKTTDSVTLYDTLTSLMRKTLELGERECYTPVRSGASLTAATQQKLLLLLFFFPFCQVSSVDFSAAFIINPSFFVKVQLNYISSRLFLRINVNHRRILNSRHFLV